MRGRHQNSLSSPGSLEDGKQECQAQKYLNLNDYKSLLINGLEEIARAIDEIFHRLFNSFLRFLVEVLCLDRFAGDAQLQDFNLLLPVKNFVGKENFYQYA